VRFIEEMLSHPVEKNQMASELDSVRNIFRKSIVARERLAAGTVLRPEHLALKKPGTGLPGTSLPDVIGRRLLRPVEPDEILQAADVAIID
jgi:sialic acid synthase SpsE